MSRLGAELTLEQVDDWFRIGRAVPKVQTVPRSKSGGRELNQNMQPIVKPARPYVPRYKRHTREGNPYQTQYAKHYQDVENSQLISGGVCTSTDQSLGRDSDTSHQLDLEGISDTMSTVSFLPEEPPNSTAVYRNYNFEHTYDKNLPITHYHEDVVDTIESNRVTVIQGSTGSGKTTQVPQYILDHYAQAGKYCNIVVTQPRRIAAMSIARRVCQERGWRLGSVVGYQVALDRFGSDDTRLMYVTTGVLLQKLISAKNMREFTHVVLDEVHERDEDSDFCLLVVRKLLRSNSPHVKVVLMSATFDSDMFAGYFGTPVLGKVEPAPVVSVEGRAYTVSEYYVEDLKTLGELPELEPNNPCIPSESMNLCKKLVQQFDNLEIQDQGKTVNGFAPKRGTVLIFLPGMGEIKDLEDHLRELTESHRLWVLPLHSSITAEEQTRVFDLPQSGFRKIILSTNIAESSITVPDIKYVIDFCLTKVLVCDPETNYSRLQVEWASKANSNQRRGRAGRVSDGRVYRMVYRKFYEEHMQEYGRPEMQRSPLDQLILQVKLLDLGEPKAILGMALSPPNLDDIERTILMLKEVGALSSLSSGAVNPHDGELTFIGRVLASLPVDIRIGKLFMLGHVFGLLEQCIIIGAAMSLKSFFARPFNADLNAYKSRLGWADGSFSDSIAYLNAYKTWESNKQDPYSGFKGLVSREQQWCKSQFIQIRRIAEVATLVKELTDRLAKFNIRIPRGRHRLPPNPGQDLLILKVVIAGAFYPNYFINGASDEQDAIRSMSGKDPCTTVMVKNLPANQGALYKHAIENLFMCCGKRPKVHFEETKAYIEFERDPNSSQTQLIEPPVYVALKLKQLKPACLELNLIDPEQARIRMEQLQRIQDAKLQTEKRLRTNRIKAATDQASSLSVRQVPLPKASQTTITLCVTEVIDCGHFWAQYGDEDTRRTMAHIQTTLNMHNGRDLQDLSPNQIKVGIQCVAPFMDVTEEFYRATVCSVVDIQLVQVFFVDYGNKALMRKDRLKQAHPQLVDHPYQAFECFLSGIKPSAMKFPDGKWPIDIIQKYGERIANKVVYAKVYSIINNALRVELVEKLPGSERFSSFNELLINHGVADVAEETYQSRQNHQQRLEEAICDSHIASGSLGTPKDNWLELPIDDYDLQRTAHRGRKFRLHGPWNPYEMSFYNMTNIGTLRAANIDRMSVNTIVLNEEPQDTHARLMVAGFVRMNATGSAMIANDTTLMPNIHGLPALITLLFAPTAELRTDRLKTRYTGALCGLGWDEETGGPALPDHDIEITFDTKIDIADICKINGVKMAINLAIGSESSSSDWGPDLVNKIQHSARKKLMSLLERRRVSVEPKNFEWPYRWNMVNEDDLLYNAVDDTEANCPTLLNLLKGIAISQPDEEEDDDPETKQEKMRKHLDWLESKAGKSIAEEKILCEVCNVMCNSPRDVYIHIQTRAHRQEVTTCLM